VLIEIADGDQHGDDQDGNGKSEIGKVARDHLK